MAAPPPALMADLVEDILLRFPPDDPASLVRAALVCKEWCRIVSGPGFRRRFCELHRSAPILGVLCNFISYYDGYFISRFLPASSCFPPLADFCHGQALDARHGRVLFRYLDSQAALYVWDPVTEERRALPILPHFDPCSWKWNATVLCAVHGACDHLDCHRGPFLVVLLDSDSDQMRVHVYSSEADTWSEPTYGPQSPTYGVQMVGTALVGNSLYFLIDVSCSILKYDLATANMSVIQLPPNDDFVVLTTVENGGLGFARLERSGVLYLCSMVTGPQGDATWTQIAVIQIQTLLPVNVEINYDFIGFVHAVGILFVGTNEGLFSIDVKSHRVRKLCDEFFERRVCDKECGDGGMDGVIPYMGFYTPDLYQYGLLPA